MLGLDWVNCKFSRNRFPHRLHFSDFLPVHVSHLSAITRGKL